MSSNVREDLASYLDGQAAWRQGNADEYPEDRRNRRSADGLAELAAKVRALPDDDPVIVALSAECERTGLDVYALVPTDPASGINVSQFRFHDPHEGGYAFLRRLVETAGTSYDDVQIDELEKHFPHEDE